MSLVGGYKYREAQETIESLEAITSSYYLLSESGAHLAITELKIISELYESALINNMPQFTQHICGYLSVKLKVVNRLDRKALNASEIERLNFTQDFMQRLNCKI